MQFGRQQLEAYLTAYNKFQSDMENDNGLLDELKKLKETLKNEEKKLSQSNYIKKSIEKDKDDIEKKAKQQELRYSRCVGKNNITVECSDLNEYTDPEIFEQKQEKIRKEYDDAIQEYCKERKQQLTLAKEQLLEEQAEYKQDKINYIHRIMQQIDNDCIEHIEERKQDVREYLNDNDKIKNTEIAKKYEVQLNKIMSVGKIVENLKKL